MSRVLLIKNANLYDPDPKGIRDILIVDEKVFSVAEHIDPPELSAPVEVVSAEGKTVIPGYVDQHVHVIGVLGTDGTGRHPEPLLAKVRGLETEGISAYMLTASYEDLRGQSG